MPFQRMKAIDFAIDIIVENINRARQRAEAHQRQADRMQTAALIAAGVKSNGARTKTFLPTARGESAEPPTRTDVCRRAWSRHAIGFAPVRLTQFGLR